MFVILEWAGGQPKVAADEVFDDQAEAIALADRLTAAMVGIGNRDQFTVHSVNPCDATEAASDR